jgi:hypothetical protein
MLPAQLTWRCSHTGKPANPNGTPEAISPTRAHATFSSAFPQQVEKAIPTGILTHLRTYWDTRGATEACVYFPQHFLSEPTSRPIFLSIFLSQSVRPHLPAYWLTWGLTETTKDLLKHAGTFLSISSAMASGAGREEAFFCFWPFSAVYGANLTFCKKTRCLEVYPSYLHAKLQPNRPRNAAVTVQKLMLPAAIKFWLHCTHFGHTRLHELAV